MGNESIASQIREYTNIEYQPDFEILKSTTWAMEDVTRLILGIILALMYMLLTALVVLDLAYITIPTFQEVVRKRGWDKTREQGVGFISRDAKDAVMEANTVQTGVSAVWIYIKKKSFSMVLFALLTLLLLTNYSVVLNIAQGIVTGFIDGINNIFSNPDVNSPFKSAISKLLN